MLVCINVQQMFTRGNQNIVDDTHPLALLVKDVLEVPSVVPQLHLRSTSPVHQPGTPESTWHSLLFLRKEVSHEKVNFHFYENTEYI